MVFELRDIKDWRKELSCTPTTLCALSGKTPEEIGELLQAAALANGRKIGPELRDNYAIDDWLKVINQLGGDWAPSEDFSSVPFELRLTIDDWMKTHPGIESETVFCDDGADKGHVFATIGGDVVDTYTGGKRVKFTRVPEDYRVLRVKRTFLIEPEAG